MCSLPTFSYLFKFFGPCVRTIAEKVEEEKEMLIVNKAIEDQKQHFGEGVRVEELELKVSPKLRNKKVGFS